MKTITLQSRFTVGDHVTLYQGGTILEDTVKEVIFYDVTLSKTQDPSKLHPRYRLQDHTGIFYDSELYKDRKEIANKILQSA